RDRVETRRDLRHRHVAPVVDVVLGDAAHAAVARLEAELHATLHLRLDARQLGRRQSLAGDARRLLPDALGHLADPGRAGPDVDPDVPRVTVRGQERVDAVRLSLPLADLLEEPRAHATAERRVEEMRGVAIVVRLRDAGRAEAEVHLLQVLLVDREPAD